MVRVIANRTLLFASPDVAAAAALLLSKAVFGSAPVNPLVTTLHQAADAGDWGAVVLHCVASGLLGPMWEEVRARLQFFKRTSYQELHVELHLTRWQ